MSDSVPRLLAVLLLLFGALLREKLPDDIAAASLYYLAKAHLKTGETGKAVKTFNRIKFFKIKLFRYRKYR